MKLADTYKNLVSDGWQVMSYAFSVRFEHNFKAPEHIDYDDVDFKYKFEKKLRDKGFKISEEI
jgi:hypothetical protein